MPNLDKAKRREEQRKKERHGMKVDGRSLLDVQRLQKERTQKADPNCPECGGSGETTFKVGAIEFKDTCPCVRR